MNYMPEHGLILISQIDLAGSSGWAGAGLLGLVLGWLLLKHLPAKDDQIKHLLTAKDAQIDKLIVDGAATVKGLTTDHQSATATLVTRNDAAMKQLRDDYKESLAGVLVHCEREVNSLATMVGKEVALQGQQIDKLTVEVRELKSMKGGK